MYPVFAEVAAKYGIDLSKRSTGRELGEMLKYFGQGSGTYLVTVDLQKVRTEAFKLSDEAQKKITRALTPPKKRVRVKPTTKKRKKR
jgi:hypothetical protein